MKQTTLKQKARTTTNALLALALMSVAFLSVFSIADAARCSNSGGGVEEKCETDGKGGCAAAAYISPSGGIAFGCAAFDYKDQAATS